jgi:hypothetical protein
MRLSKALDNPFNGRIIPGKNYLLNCLELMTGFCLNTEDGTMFTLCTSIKSNYGEWIVRRNRMNMFKIPAGYYQWLPGVYSSP